MSTTRKIAHNTIIQMSGKAVATILGLISIGILTRYLGIEQFGWYTTAISFLQFVGILVDFGMIPVTAQMLSSTKHDKAVLLQNLLGFRFITATLFLGIAPIVGLLFPYPTEVKQAIGLLAISFVATEMYQIFVGYHQTKLSMHVQAIGEVLGRLSLVIGLLLLTRTKAPFLPIMAVVGLGSIVHTAYLWLRTAKETRTSFRFDWPIWKEIIQTSWPIAISIIFNVVYLRGDLLILSWHFSQSAVGIYGAAYRVIDILTQTAMLLMGVMLPLLAASWVNNKKDIFRAQLQQAFDSMMLFALPMTVGAMILSRQIMVFVAGEDFAVSGWPLRILALTVFAVYVGAVYGHTAVAINRQRQVMWIYISCAIFTLVAYLTLIPRFGIPAAAWLTVCSEAYVAILLFIAVTRYTDIPVRMHTFRKLLVATLVMGGVIYVIQKQHILLVVLIGGIVYAATLFALKAVSKETIREIVAVKK